MVRAISAQRRFESGIKSRDLGVPTSDQVGDIQDRENVPIYLHGRSPESSSRLTDYTVDQSRGEAPRRAGTVTGIRQSTPIGHGDSTRNRAYDRDWIKIPSERPFLPEKRGNDRFVVERSSFSSSGSSSSVSLRAILSRQLSRIERSFVRLVIHR